MSNDKVYISPDGRVHSTPQAAIAAGLNFEQVSNTGAGRDQAPENVPAPSPPPAPAPKS